MSETVIKIENLSKLYRLGVWGTGTLKDDLAKSWARLRPASGRNPTAPIGQSNELAKGATLSEAKGEVLGIIGKNGAGKSTLLKILSQITGPTGGSIKMKGRVASLIDILLKQNY